VLLRHRHFYARLELLGGHGGVDRGAPRVEEEGLGTGAAAGLLQLFISLMVSAGLHFLFLAQ
jgi:hypothetical protein